MRRGGFTLMELLIVLVVLTVLVTVASVSYIQQRRRTEYRGMRANVNVLAEAMKNHFYTTNTYVTSANTGQTNSRYGTRITEGRFCRYLVFMSGVNARVRVQYWTRACGSGAQSTYTFDIHGTQLFCAGGNCMTG